MVLILAFIPGAAWSIVLSLIEPALIGSHGAIYSEAARAWLTGGNPWHVGPPAVVFGGPPTMLLPFAPFAFAGWDISRFAWLGIDIVVAVWALRRLGIPPYWIAFPPLCEAIVLGHPEVLVLGLLVLRNPIGGLALLIKPYAAFAMLAERRWQWLVVGGIAGIATLAFMPWSLFISELGEISATLVRQNRGDSTFGQPLPMIVAALALAVLGPRRALWFATPVLWPYAQPIYKVASMPLMPPILALAWATQIQGMTLVGIVLLSVLVLVERWRALPGWLAEGIRPAAKLFVAHADGGRGGSPTEMPRGSSVRTA